MTPLEKACQTFWDTSEIGLRTWDETGNVIKDEIRNGMRAALLALTECDFPDRIEFQDGNDTVILHPNNGASKGLFRKFCRAIATEGNPDV